MVQIPTHRPPTHPGEMLLEEFLNPMSLTQRELADVIYVPYQRINDFVHGRRSVTPGTAMRLAKFFNMSADFWMNLQMRWDMYHVQQEETAILKKIEPVHTP
jgi:antitoxin HigA-1